MISIFGSTSIPFPLYFAIHFPILFKSSFTISITKLFYFQPFYYSAFHYSAFYYSAFYYSAFLLFSLLLFSSSIIQLYYSATFLLVRTTYTRKAHGINEEAVRNMYGKHEVLRTVQLLREMRKEHGCHKETAWVNKQRMKSHNTTPPSPYPSRITDLRITAMGNYSGHRITAAVVEPRLEWSSNGRKSSVESISKRGKVLVVRFECRSLHRYVLVVHSECRWLRDCHCHRWQSGSPVCHSVLGWKKDRCWVWNRGWIPL